MGLESNPSHSGKKHMHYHCATSTPKVSDSELSHQNLEISEDDPANLKILVEENMPLGLHMLNQWGDSAFVWLMLFTLTVKVQLDIIIT